MVVLLALLLLLPAPRAGAEAPRINVVVSAEGSGLPSPGGLRDGLQRLFSAEYGRFVSLSFVSPQQGDLVARMDLSPSGTSVTVSTTLTQGRQSRSALSTVPAAAPMSLTAAMAGDLAFLYFSSQDFAAFPLAAPPGMTAFLPTDALADLLAAKGDDREPIGIASGPGAFTVSFPHGYISLGPRFRMTMETARDLFAEAAAREQMQLSGVVRGAGDELFLLSQDSGKIARVNPRVGTREVVDAPGLSAVKGRMLDRDTLAAFAGGEGPAAFTLYGPHGAARLALGAFYASTFGVDGEGNLWVWDIAERRIRVFTRGGSEIYSIKPLFRASLLPIPQQLEVFDDGSFLLAGSGEVWKFENTGIPVWRLTRLPGRPGEQLPASFEIAADRADGSFVLLDAPSRRLLSFASSRDDQDLTGFYAGLDQRKPDGLQEGAARAKDGGLSLVELTFATLLSRRGGTAAAASAAGLDVLRDRARLSLQFADSVARDLLDARADAAYLRAGEAARALSAAAPDDQEAAANLTSAAARRQELRAALAPGPAIRILSAEVHTVQEAGCASAVQVVLRVRNDSGGSLNDVRVHANLPTTPLGPALALMEALGPGEEREVRLDLGPDAAAAVQNDTTLPAAVLVTAERVSAGLSASSLLTAAVTSDTSARSAADGLACRADPSDPLVQSLPDALLGAARASADTGGAVSAVLDMLGGLRGTATGGPAVPSPFSVRQSLRSLDPSEQSWIVVMGSVAASQGIPVGFLAWPDRALLLVDTGQSLDAGIAASPSLAPYAAVLGKLSRNGTLCLPFAAGGAAAPGAAAGLQLCAQRVVDGAPVAWLDTQPAGAAPRPVPFPLAPPASAPNQPSTSGFFAALAAALAALPPS